MIDYSKDYSLNKAVEDMLDKTHWKKRLMGVSIKDDWEKIMGKTIAQYTTSLFLTNKKLIIRTNIAPLRNELSLNKESIIEKINTYYNREMINEIELG